MQGMIRPTHLDVLPLRQALTPSRVMQSIEIARAGATKPTGLVQGSETGMSMSRPWMELLTI